MKRALITGINGQDGSYLSELLLSKNYQVFGTVRPDSDTEQDRAWIDANRDKFKLFYVDITDHKDVSRAICDSRPDEIYNLASQSRIDISFEQPLRTLQTNAGGALTVFEAARLSVPDARIYQASSSEMFGDRIDADGFQRETTPMDPASPYAASKLLAYQTAKNYRSSYGMFVSNGILFNHESPRRGANFVTSKICREAVKIKYGGADRLELGNVEARRDWGHSKDFVRAMWLILQENQPNDFVCATGITHTVRDVVRYVFQRLGLDENRFLKIDPDLLRPADRHSPRGDSSKLRRATGWQTEYTFETLLDEMIDRQLSELTAGP
jgi:GDPmannose 4,6-dehydratase